MQDILKTMAAGSEIDKAEYKVREEKLRLRLQELQKRLAASKKSALILMNGVEGSGKGETTKKILEWLDARGVETTAFWTPNNAEAEYPPLWRFWNKLPARGRMGIFFGSWYTHPIMARVFRETDRAGFSQSLDEIRKLEKMLSAEGVILIKLWMYLSPADQKDLLRNAKKKVATRWRISAMTKKFARKRKRFHKIDLEALTETHNSAAPWSLVDARFARYREIFAGETLAARLENALSSDAGPEYAGIWTPARKPLLAMLDMTLKLDEAEYKEKLLAYSARIAQLSDKLSSTRKSLLLAFEGPDAAGKGGAIRRVTYGIDPRHYRVNAVSAPTDVEKEHPYLWRFWQKSPPEGRLYIFDRSWYGRVLVERIEKFCTEAEWQRAFGEINDFEKALVDSHTTIRKFYLSISSEEQLARFRERKVTPYKQYKLTEEDWRNRDKWDAYQKAADDMFENTSTSYAPWIVVEANDKNYARIKVLKKVMEALEETVG
jgi:AMP-polyphosphate phosphotransferase